MVDVNAIANFAIQEVNPDVGAELWKNGAAVTLPSGKRDPVFKKVPIVVQVQALSYGDLQQLDALNIQGTRRAIYTSTQVASVIRVAQKGGDLIVFPKGVLIEGTTWLAAHQLERWPTWCKFAITLQNDNYEAFAC